MPSFSRNFEHVLRRVRRHAKWSGLSRSEMARLMVEARRMVGEALARGLKEEEVRVLLTTDGEGSVALFIGDEASVFAASAERERQVRAGFH